MVSLKKKTQNMPRPGFEEAQVGNAEADDTVQYWPHSAVNSRLLLLGQCRRLHR